MFLWASIRDDSGIILYAQIGVYHASWGHKTGTYRLDSICPIGFKNKISLRDNVFWASSFFNVLGSVNTSQ